MTIRRHLLSVAVALLIIAGGASTADAAPKTWEAVRTERPEVKTVVKETDIEIKTARGLIVLTINRQLPIKVVTILGRTICSDTLAAGSYELHLAHGVYIVKIGETTFKIAV